MNTKESSPLANMLRLLGGHLHCIATEMLTGSDGKGRPTRFGLGLGESVHVIVEIRPHEGTGSGCAPISDEEAKAPFAVKPVDGLPETSTHANAANVWDHVAIYDATDPKGEPTGLGPRGKALYSGNRVGACNFFAAHCESEIALCSAVVGDESKKLILPRIAFD